MKQSEYLHSCSLRVLPFPLCMLRSTAVGVDTALAVFTCIFAVYGTGELGHLRSPDRLAASKLSIVFRALPEIWRFSNSSQPPE